MTDGTAQHPTGHARHTLVALMAMIAVACLTLIAVVGPGGGPGQNTAERSTPESTSAEDNSSCNPYPFVTASTTTMRASKKKAFAFYFPAFPVSIDDRSSDVDYYHLWLTRVGPPAISDRPIPRPPYKTANFRQLDFETEIRQAIAAGLDGFIFEANPFTSDVRFQQLPAMLAAAHAVDPGFKIVLGPDFQTNAGASPQPLADYIEKVQSNSSLYRTDDGSLVLAPFYPERQPISYWSGLLNDLSNNGVKATMLPIFLSGVGSGQAPWASISAGLSTWGARWASSASGYVSQTKITHGFNRIFMSPVAFEDVRSASNSFYEANNSSELRSSMLAAINGDADWIDLVAWNDFTESWIEPTVNRGYSALDLAAYYIAWFKLGSAPNITQDVLYYFHRSQSTTATITASGQQQPTVAAGDAVSNQVELLAFLKAPGQLVITQGRAASTINAPAGVTSFRVPVIPGTTPSFQLVRNSQPVINLTSSTPIATSVTIPDLSYHGGESSSCPRLTATGLGASSTKQRQITKSTKRP